MAKKNINFIESDNIIKKILTFSLPIIISEIFQTFYSSVDSILIGRLVSKESLASIGICTSIITFIVSFFSGLSIGSNVLVSVAFGENDRQKIKTSVEFSVCFSFYFGILITLIGMLIAPNILHWINIAPELYIDSLLYIRIYFIGLTFTSIYNISAGILRAFGESKCPSFALIISCILNIFLDIFFITVFHLGLMGVAFATIISQLLSSVIVCKKIKTFVGKFSIFSLHYNKDTKLILRDIIDIGFFSGLQNALISASNVFIMSYINLFDTSSIAGITTALKVDKLVLLPAKSFGLTMTTLVSQNIGANQYKNLKSKQNMCILFGFCVCITLSTIVYIFAGSFIRVFSDDNNVVQIGMEMLRIIIPFISIMSLRESICGILRANKKSKQTMLISLIGMVGFKVPFISILMNKHFSIYNIYYCYPFSWIMTTMLTVLYYNIVRKYFPSHHNGEKA